MLQRRGEIFASRIVIPSTLRPLLRRVEITRSLRTTDVREARRRLGLWETHIGSLLSLVRKHGSSMTPDQVDDLTRQYLATTLRLGLGLEAQRVAIGALVEQRAGQGAGGIRGGRKRQGQ